MDIYRIVFSPIRVNTYVIADQTGECAVIDCGCYSPADSEVLAELFEKNKLKPVLLLNTHCHPDHVFGNNFMLTRYNLLTLCGSEEERIRKSAVNLSVILGLTMEKPPEPRAWLEDGQTITFGETELTALHVPGHSPGSYAFWCRKEKVVFTGDALFKGSIGRSDLPGGNHQTLLDSIRTKLLVLPPETVVYPGHEDKTTIGDEIKNNPYLSEP